MNNHNLLAIVGSPSVGKSTIFNRIIGEKKSIIEEERGVTRDRIYGDAEWLNRHFKCVDTGGIEPQVTPFVSVTAKINIPFPSVIFSYITIKYFLSIEFPNF